MARADSSFRSTGREPSWLAKVVLPAFIAASVSQSVAADSFETRCGWFDNPTPGNVSLFDRDAEWIIGIQGGYQVAADWPWPKFAAGQWKKTNGNHGYGCACLAVKTDPLTRQVLAIGKVQARPLQSCRQDLALKKWRRTFK